MNEEDPMKYLMSSIVDGDKAAAIESARRLLDRGLPAYDIVINGCSRAMKRVGKLYEEGEYYIPEILMAAKAFEGVMEVVRPFLKEGEVRASGTVIMGVCEGDIHSLGKNIVILMLEAAGFDVIDLGVDVPASKFVDAAVEKNADLIGVSALMTSSMLRIKDVIALAREKGVRAKIMIGGGPVTQEYAHQVGADGYGEDAVAAVRMAVELTKSGER